MTLIQSSLKYIKFDCFRIMTAVIIKVSILWRYDAVNIGIYYRSFVETLCLHLQECQKSCLEDGDSIHFYAASLYITGYPLLYPRRLESSITFIKDISLFGENIDEFKVKYKTRLCAVQHL